MNSIPTLAKKRVMRICGSATYALLLATALLSSANDVLAQPADYVAIEGYAFDAKTLRPLKNVQIVYHEEFDGISSREEYALTDVNGFYSLTVDYTRAITIDTRKLSAACQTKRGVAQNSINVYQPMRTSTPYRRDFYIALPRNASRCEF